MNPTTPYRPLGYATPFDSILDPGEKLVWTGRPRQGMYLQSSDWVAVPFSLFWCGFVVFWEISALRGPARSGGGSIVFPLFGIPFVLVGLYMLVGRFFHDAWVRRNTQYAVTDRRAILLGGINSSRVTSLNLNNLREVSLVKHADGTGTVYMGQAASKHHAPRPRRVADGVRPRRKRRRGVPADSRGTGQTDGLTAEIRHPFVIRAAHGGYSRSKRFRRFLVIPRASRPAGAALAATSTAYLSLVERFPVPSSGTPGERERCVHHTNTRKALNA